MKKLVTLTAAFSTGLALAGAALAADDMAGMKMNSGATDAMAPNNAALTDAVVRKVDPSTGMVAVMRALGTTDLDFFDGLMLQLVNAGQGKGPSDNAVDFMW